MAFTWSSFLEDVQQPFRVTLLKGENFVKNILIKSRENCYHYRNLRRIDFTKRVFKWTLIMNNQQAILSNEPNYTIFRVGDKVVRFRAPYSLEHYTEVKEWDHGNIVAMAKYKQNDKPEEEYIDVVPFWKTYISTQIHFWHQLRK